MTYTIELSAQQFDLLMNILGCAETNDRENGMPRSAAEIEALSRTIDAQARAQEA